MDNCFSFSKEARNKIKIEKPVETVDSYGGRTITWQTVQTVWASLKPSSGREVFAQQAQQKRVSHVATIRYISDISNITNIKGYRVNYEGRLFDLNYLTNLDRDLKFEGDWYQRLYLEENGPGVNG